MSTTDPPQESQVTSQRGLRGLSFVTGKFFALFVTTGVAVCLITLFFYWTYQVEFKKLSRIQATQSTEVIRNAKAALNKRLLWPAADAYFLSQNIRDLIIRTPENPELIESLITQSFSNLMHSRGLQYMQIRLLDPEGKELVRLDRNSNAQIVNVPDGKLQDKSHRYYVTDALKLTPGKVYISNLDLNVERNKVVYPFNPTIRYAAKVFGAKEELLGLVIINYSGTDIVNRVRGIGGQDLWLADHKGNWLISPQKAWDWSAQLDANTNRKVATEYPDIWQAMASQNGKGQSFDNDRLVTYDKVTMKITRNDLPFSLKPSFKPWRLIHVTPAEQFYQARQRIMDSLLYYYIGIMIIAVVLAVYIGLLWYQRQQIRLALIDRNEQLHLKNKLFLHQAKTDFLTGIKNRQSIDVVLSEQLNSAKRHNRSFSIIFIDVDHFKRINDDHGHDVGDLVLKQLCDLISSQIRSIDKFGRWGGEEFIIVAPETNQAEAQAFAEKIRAAIGNYYFENGLRVTASFGVTQYRKDETINTLLKRADSILYNAKRNGRNRVETSELSVVKGNQKN